MLVFTNQSRSFYACFWSSKISCSVSFCFVATKVQQLWWIEQVPIQSRKTLLWKNTKGLDESPSYRLFWSIFPEEWLSCPVLDQQSALVRVLRRRNVASQSNPSSIVRTPRRMINLSHYRLVLLENSAGLHQNVFPWLFYVEKKRKDIIPQRWSTSDGLQIHLGELGVNDPYEMKSQVWKWLVKLIS